ncbi:MAG: CPBP family intramembrane metalloprotease [Chloroflexi bacterium]|nr:CPBP family intramembrane metalloprotease [Chloroflexota bacterium]
MSTQYLSFVRDQIGGLIQNNKLIIAVEILVVALFPLFLVLIQMPGTIIPLLLLGWLSLWLRHQSWKGIGLRKPASWFQVILIGSGVAVVGVYLSEKAISPLLLRLTGETQPQVIEPDSLRGNSLYFSFLLVGIWLLAAVGEELVYRGYVLNRLVDLFGCSKAAWGIGLLVSSLMFSFGHGIFNQAVIIGGFLIGLVEGGLYLASRRNLWLSIVFHGAWDTIFLTLFFLSPS